MGAAASSPGFFSADRWLSRRRLEVETIFGILYPLADAGLVFAAAVLAFVLHFKLGLGPDTPYKQAPFFYPFFGTYEAVFVLAGAMLGLYRSPWRVGAVTRAFMVTSVSSLALLTTITAVYFVLPSRLEFAKVLAIFFWAVAITFVFLGRTLLGRMVKTLADFGVGTERVLILGAGQEGRRVLDILSKYPGPRYNVVGFLDDAVNDSDPAEGAQVRVLGKVSILAGVLAEHAIDKVIVAIPAVDHERMLEIADACGSARIAVWLLPDHFQLMVSAVDENELSGLPLMAINEVRLKGVSRATKRTTDALIAGSLLVLLSSPMLLVALLIWLTDRGSIFYVQERMGHDGRRFPMLKFRSMAPDADREGRTWTIKNDPRITRIGRLIRRLSIDELPQLINVLRGQMSLVGPRPERPQYVAEFSRLYPKYMQRHREKSGMTGWAQVNGLRGDVSIAARTLYDLYYVENWSLLLDLRILLRTIVEVVRGSAS